MYRKWPRNDSNVSISDGVRAGGKHRVKCRLIREWEGTDVGIREVVMVDWLGRYFGLGGVYRFVALPCHGPSKVGGRGTNHFQFVLGLEYVVERLDHGGLWCHEEKVVNCDGCDNSASRCVFDVETGVDS